MGRSRRRRRPKEEIAIFILAHSKSGYSSARSVSSLGHKPTYMSALPLKADMCGANSHVRFGPKADMVAVTPIPLNEITVRTDEGVEAEHRCLVGNARFTLGVNPQSFRP